MSDDPAGDAAETLHEIILESLPLGVFLCDTSGAVLYMNRAYAEHLGATPRAVIGRNIVEFIPDTRAIKVMASGVKEIGDLCMVGQGEQRKTLVVNRIPLRGEDGQVTGMISLCLFSSPADLKALAAKIEQLDMKVSFYRRRMQSALSARFTLDSIQGESPAIAHAKTRLVNYAKTDFPVLIQGATGTGKELFANALHTLSARKDGSFVSINCAAVPLELFESELFGYAAGAFSGSSKEGKVGLIELADQGTLFLDEVGDLPLAAQVKLLRVLEEKIVHRVGSTKPHAVDFRLVTATNRDLGDFVARGSFREDLFYRINTLPLHIPSLSERGGDIPLIVRSLLARMGKADMEIAPEAMQALAGFDWPGNVRELRNTLIHAVSLCEGGILTLGDLPPAVAALGQDAPRPAAGSLREANAGAELALIRQALAANSGNMLRTAKALGVSRATLYEKCRKYGLRRDADRAGDDLNP